MISAVASGGTRLPPPSRRDDEEAAPPETAPPESAPPEAAPLETAPPSPGAIRPAAVRPSAAVLPPLAAVLLRPSAHLPRLAPSCGGTAAGDGGGMLEGVDAATEGVAAASATAAVPPSKPRLQVDVDSALGNCEARLLRDLREGNSQTPLRRLGTTVVSFDKALIGAVRRSAVQSGAVRCGSVQSIPLAQVPGSHRQLNPEVIDSCQRSLY